MDSNGYNPNDGLLDNLKQLLDSKKYCELKQAIESKEHFQEICERGHSIIPLFADQLNKRTRVNEDELFECCEFIIYKLAELADPDDCLFEFIEYAEKPDEELFLVMLKAMGISLMKTIDKNRSALGWCLSTVIRHINDMPKIEDFKLEGDEYTILENTDSCRMVINLYNEIFKFLKPIVEFVSSRESSVDTDDRNTIITFLLKLLGRPLVYMRLDYTKTKGEFRCIAEDIINEIIKFKIELTHFLNFVTPYNPCRKTTVSDVIDFDFNNISLGVLYYLIYKEGVCIDYVSHVYHPLFFLQAITTVSLDMLIVDHSNVQNKGLLLMEMSLKRVDDFFLDFNGTNCEMFEKIAERLSQIIIYSDVKENRIIGVRVFRLLLEKFNSEGRYYILYNLQNREMNPNFTGYIITLTKDFVVAALKTRNKLDLEYFTGPKLRVILSKFCLLPNGAESDLIELSDQIIAALNFVRFLLIRDNDNTLGLAEFVPELKSRYLEPLRVGLALSIAHYKLQANTPNSAFDEKLNVTVGGMQLPSLSDEQKLGLLSAALNTFDLIEALLVRVEECLEEFERKNNI